MNHTNAINATLHLPGQILEAPFKKMRQKIFPNDNLDDTSWCAHFREVGQIQLEWNEYGEDDDYDENDEDGDEEFAQVGWLPGAGGSKETPTSHQWCCCSWTLFATLPNLEQVNVKYLQLCYYNDSITAGPNVHHPYWEVLPKLMYQPFRENLNTCDQVALQWPVVQLHFWTLYHTAVCMVLQDKCVLLTLLAGEKQPIGSEPDSVARFWRPRHLHILARLNNAAF